jgi:hypothetical protein
MSARGTTPYETLVELAERELELLGEGRYEELGVLHRERAALIATLPATAPPEAAPALERAALLGRSVMVEIMRRREAILLELATLEQARRMARGYSPPRPRARIEANA